jgi:hypothetical protein
MRKNEQCYGLTPFTATESSADKSSADESSADESSADESSSDVIYEKNKEGICAT